MTEEQLQQLIDLAGQVGSEMYRAAYQRAIVNGMVGLITTLALLSAFIWLAFYLTKTIRRWQANDVAWMEEPTSIIVCMGCILTPIAIFLSVLTLGDSITALVSPQYGALELLADLIK